MSELAVINPVSDTPGSTVESLVAVEQVAPETTQVWELWTKEVRTSYVPGGWLMNRLCEFSQSLPDAAHISFEGVAGRAVEGLLATNPVRYEAELTLCGCTAAIGILSQRQFENEIVKAEAITCAAEIGVQICDRLRTEEPANRLITKSIEEETGKLRSIVQEIKAVQLASLKASSPEREAWSSAAEVLTEFAQALERPTETLDPAGLAREIPPQSFT